MAESPDSDPTTPTLRWSVEQRVAFAARRLYWDGTINRDDLMRRFGVSANQATADLARLKDAYPDGFAYDTVSGRLVHNAAALNHIDETPWQARADLVGEVPEGHDRRLAKPSRDVERVSIDAATPPLRAPCRGIALPPRRSARLARATPPPAGPGTAAPHYASPAEPAGAAFRRWPHRNPARPRAGDIPECRVR